MKRAKASLPLTKSASQAGRNSSAHKGGTDCPQSVGIGSQSTCWDNTFHLLLCERRNRSRITKFLCRLRCGSRRRAPSSRSLILGAAETENRPENESQKRESESEADSFPKTFCQVDGKNYRDYEIHERDEHQKDPPPWPADNLAPNIKIIDWDDAGPTGLAGFREHFPHRHDYQQCNEQSENHRDWAWRLALSAVLDLCEQSGGREQNGLRNFDE